MQCSSSARCRSRLHRRVVHRSRLPCTCHTLPTACLASPRLAFPSQIKDWSELDKLAGLPCLREVLFLGNPIYEGMDKRDAKLQVLKRLPRLAKIDNEMVIDDEREAASKL